MAVDIGGYFDKLSRRGRGGLHKVRDTVNRARDKVGGTTPGQRRTGGRRSEATVTVEYTPKLDGDPDPGDVVWTWVPFEEDPTQGKDRPVVVIGRRKGNLVGVPLTTKRDDREAQVVVGTGNWDPERRTSYARIWRMLDIDPTRMRREGAVLARDRFDAVVAAVDEYYDVTYASSAEPARSTARRDPTTPATAANP